MWLRRDKPRPIFTTVTVSVNPGSSASTRSRCPLGDKHFGRVSQSSQGSQLHLLPASGPIRPRSSSPLPPQRPWEPIKLPRSLLKRCPAQPRRIVLSAHPPVAVCVCAEKMGLSRHRPSWFVSGSPSYSPPRSPAAAEGVAEEAGGGGGGGGGGGSQTHQATSTGAVTLIVQ